MTKVSGPDCARKVGDDVVSKVRSRRHWKIGCFLPLVQFKYIACGIGQQGEDLWIRIDSIHALHLRQCFNLFDELLCLCFATALKVRIDQGLHCMVLVAFISHVGH